MMINLFSNFDPLSSSMNLPFNWINSILWIFLTPFFMWMIPSRMYFIEMSFIKFIFIEMKLLINEMKNSFMPLLFISLLIFIFFTNLSGLFPFIFTSSSHPSFSFSLAFPMWLTFIFYNFFNFFWISWAHMIPNNTPMILMPFMVIIETISLLIRPITLSIRLSANMISGHLLLTLIGLFSSPFSPSSNLFIICQLILFILEISVSLIQAYVFTMLISLYFKETMN